MARTGTVRATAVDTGRSRNAQDADQPPIPDLVRRDFTATVPGTKMVGDITYVPTWEGWVYPATVIDCYSKKVILTRWTTTTRHP